PPKPYWPPFLFGRPIFRPSVHAGANECKSFAPVFFLVALHRRCIRVLHFEPIGGSGPSVKNCCCSRRITNSRESDSRSSTGGHSNYRSRSRRMDSQICVSRNQPSDKCHHRGN